MSPIRWRKHLSASAWNDEAAAWKHSDQQQRKSMPPLHDRRRLPRYYYSGQYGDQREDQASDFMRQMSPAGNPEAALKAFEDFHECRRRLIHVGPQKGKHLDDAILQYSPKKVLELGSYIGYSAIRIARLLGDGAHLYSIEKNEDNANLAEGNIAHAGLRHRVTVLRGTPQENVDWLRQHAPFEFVFMDHKKLLYHEEIQRLERWGVVQTGTVVVADNIGGRKNTQFRCGYEDHVRKSGHYESRFFWGTRDGIEISRAVQVSAKTSERDVDSPIVSSTTDKRNLPKSDTGEGWQISMSSNDPGIAQPPSRRWVPKLRHLAEEKGTEHLTQSKQTTPCAKKNESSVSSVPSRARVWKKQSQSLSYCNACQKQSSDGAYGEGQFCGVWYCNSCWKAWELQSAALR